MMNKFGKIVSKLPFTSLPSQPHFIPHFRPVRGIPGIALSYTLPIERKEDGYYRIAKVYFDVVVMIAFINKKMNPNIANLKKRKLLPGAAEDLELPSAKHICCETVADSEYDEYDISCMSSMVTEDDVSVVDTQADSTQESKSFHGDAQSAKVDASVENTNSYDEASTVSDHSGSSSSGNGLVSFGSSIIGNKKDGKEAEQCHNEDTSWHDIDGLEECMSTQYCHDSSEPTAGVLHDFLSSSGVDPNIYVLSSEILGVDQETPPGRSKPTIDQEFEQYFSMLML